jgi:predicted ATPase
MRANFGFEIGRIKGFAETATVPLAPITLLFGWNSAGKSTVLQSLLLLKQTLDEADPFRPSLVANGSLTQLGSFQNLVHRHETEATVSLGVDSSDLPWTAGPRPPFRSPQVPGGVTLKFRQIGSESRIVGGEWRLRYSDRTLRLCFDMAVPNFPSDERRQRPTVSLDTSPPARRGISDFLRYLRDSGEQDALWKTFAGDARRIIFGPPALNLAEISDEELDTAVAALTLTNLAVGRRMDRTTEGLIFAPEIGDLAPRRAGDEGERSREQDVERVVAFTFGLALNRVDRLLRQVTSRLTYLGPFRQPPERLVLLTGEQFADVGTAGENTIALLARSESLRRDVNVWLKRLGIPYGLAIDPLVSTRQMLGDVLVAGLKENGTGTAVGMRDVGFGVSQILPVVVQAVAGQGTLLAVEQPELHVHPRLQAELGDLFAERSKQGARFLLETHSEHLVLRLLAWVRSGRLDPDDLSIVYVDRDGENNSVLRPLRVDEDGEFVDRWPHGFFTERRAELGI